MKQGKLIKRARTITLALVFVAVIISLAFDSGLGTPSSFGIDEFFLLCPLGGIEAFIASKSFIPVTLISLAVVVVLSLAFGRVWCTWGCPAPVIRRFFKRDPKPDKVSTKATNTDQELSSTADDADKLTPADEGTVCDRAGCSAVYHTKGLIASLRHIGNDKRTWVLIAVLIVTLIAGFPFFCLVCPIGLTYGTVGSLWHLFVDKQVTLSCIVFPAALVIELVIYRKWCLDICPVAGLLNIFGQFARLFRPHIDASTCLSCTETSECKACLSACPEHIDLHADDAVIQLGECTRCGECVRHCPTASLKIKAAPNDPVS